MTADRAPLFCDLALAERIERVEAQLVTLAARAAHRRNGGRGFVIPVAGGVAIFAETDSPFNKVVGLGFAGVPDAAALDEIEQAFAAHGAPAQVELPHPADPATASRFRGESGADRLVPQRAPDRAPSGSAQRGPAATSPRERAMRGVCGLTRPRGRSISVLRSVRAVGDTRHGDPDARLAIGGGWPPAGPHRPRQMWLMMHLPGRVPPHQSVGLRRRDEAGQPQSSAV